MGEILRFAVAHLLGDRRRTVAALVAVLIAVTSFAVLTGTVETQRLQVMSTVESNYRSTYDILVRPVGAATALERAEGAVRPNFLAETYGGVTLEQVRQIAGLPNVEIAAPVALLGMTTRNVRLTVDVAEVLGERDRALVRFVLHGAVRNASGTSESQSGFLYLTRSPLEALEGARGEVPSRPALVERTPTGRVTVCLASNAAGRAETPNDAFNEMCWSALASETGQNPRVEALLSIPLAVAAIDPEAERRLTGLDQAIVDGRPLKAGDGSGRTPDTGGLPPLDVATAIMASSQPLDFQARLTVEELPEATITKLMGTTDPQRRREVVQIATLVRRLPDLRREAADAYAEDIVANTSSTANADESLIALALIQPGQVGYQGGATLVPQHVPLDPRVWLSEPPDGTEYGAGPPSVSDTSYRQVRVLRDKGVGPLLAFDVVGTYDPDLLPRTSALNEVPLETYRTSVLTGADEASREVLGDRPMSSDLNPGGYVQSPPALLVSLAALPVFWDHFDGLNREAPVSSVRVRVSGVTGMGAADRERIRLVAEEIQSRTGLEVDITIGASLSNRQVALTASTSGTPALLLNEQWTKKGVAVQIAQALDVKSLFLLGLVLGSSALTVWLTAMASVQTRRREIATLACLGWRPGLRRLDVVLELGLIGLVAALIGALLAVPIAGAVNVNLAWTNLASAIPLGVLIAVLPGLAATAVAGSVAPAEAFRPRALGRGSMGSRGVGGPIGVGLAMIGQRPGRVIVGALGVALAVASITLLADVVGNFQGAVVGSFLGDAVSLQVRTPDIAAAVLLAVLGITALGTLLFLGLAEDAQALAALRAVGWTDGMLARVIVTQALLVGLIGAVVGAACAAGVRVGLVGPLAATWFNTGGLVVLGALGACLITGLVPAAWMARSVTARVLSSP
ncbi:MAG: ABC transporter permease [Micropruina sp.]